jgi:ferric-dicitrate binding protein FerR (iron transport regulator)
MEQTDIIIIKYLSGEISPEEQKLLLKWLEESEENKKYFRSLKDTCDLIHFEADLKESRVGEQWAKFLKTISNNYETRKSATRKAISLTLIRYAAVFISGILCLQLFHFLPEKADDKSPAITKIETGAGDKSKITLPDGSTVWINACSSITYDHTFGEDTRSVTLNGEAYFEVKTDTAKPFMVHADHFTYMVTGTSFNVYSYKNETKTSLALLEGGVTAEYDSHTVKIHPGEMLVYDKTAGRLTVKKTDVNILSSWCHGEFIFENMTFEDLSKRLARMFDVHFAFENREMMKASFSGTLRYYDSLDTIMRVIKTSNPALSYRIEENIIHIR